jgi:alkylated DNA repair protein alkB family protein 8
MWNWIRGFTDQYHNNNVVYDIGCGSGRNMINIKDKISMIGVDNCDAFLDICKGKSLEVKKGCMTELPLNDSSGDAIISIASFHHLASDTRRLKALNEMSRVIKPGGRILLSVWSKHQPENTRRKFTYGNNIVPWNKKGVIYERYYYIFGIKEINRLFQKASLCVKSHVWDCGNEIFVLVHC